MQDLTSYIRIELFFANIFNAFLGMLFRSIIDKNIKLAKFIYCLLEKYFILTPKARSLFDKGTSLHDST
ncbi:MAG: hypothetical protein IGR78_15795 [Fischerella thermalis M58_A2018_009]|nr:hypothetical protein [Fischerella thermalis M58_A2018_009]